MDIIRFFSKYFWVVYIVLITILCFIFSKTVIFFVNRSLEVPFVKKSKVNVIRETPQINPSINDYKIIFERNLFNISGQEQVSNRKRMEILNPNEIPVSTSGMELVGTFVGSQKTSIALIKADGEVNTYHVDQNVKGSSILKISRREVIIDRNGVLEKLIMEEIGKSIAVQNPQPIFRDSPGIQQTSNNKWIIDRKKVPIKNIGSFIRQCRLIPHTVDGKPAGLKITGIIKGSVIDRIGFVDGDIIKRVDGTDIKTPDDAYKAYQKLQTNDKVVIDLERNGLVTPFTYEVKN